MGRMTLNEFRQEIVDGLQRGTQEQVGVSRLNRWIFNATIEFAYAFKFRELEGLVDIPILTGAVSFPQPVGFRAMHETGIMVFNVENYEGKVLPETRDQYIIKNRTVGSMVVPGRPSRYHLYGLEFLFRPSADVDYRFLVHYWKSMSPMLEDDEVSIFQADWDDAIFLGGLYRGFRHFNEFDRYQNVKNDYLGCVRSRAMPEDLEEFPEGGINPVTYRDNEEASVYGEPGSEPFGEIP